MTQDTTYDMTRQYTKFRLFTQKSVLTLLLLLSAMGVKATDYVITYTSGGTTYYLGMNGNSLVAKTQFDPTCIWTCRNGNSDASLGSTSYSLRNKNNNQYYLTTSCSRSGNMFNRVYTWSALTVQTSASDMWRSSNGTDGNVYAYYSTGSGWTDWNRSASINVSSLSMIDDNTSSSKNYNVTITSQGPADNTTAPTISIQSVADNKITFRRTDLGGTYTPAYTRYVFNNTTHNYYNGTDYAGTTPTIPLSPTYEWGFSPGGSGGGSSIDANTGELSLPANVTGNITVQLTVSNNDPAISKTVDYTLTRGTVAENVSKVTTLSNPTITPTNASINYQGSQAFTGSATATTTTTTVPAHVTLTGGEDTYYYYNGALYTSTDGFKTVSGAVSQEVTYSWTLADGSGQNDNAVSRGHLTPTSGTGNTFTVTYPNASDINRNAVLTLTATTVNQTTGSSGSLTKTATTTVTATQTQPTAITADVASMTICQGSEGTINYTLTPAGAYNHVTVTSTNEDIAYYTGTAATDGTITIHAGNTVDTATLTLTAAPGVTTTVTVTTQGKVIPPAITFNNTTNQVTISSETTGATIYYTTDGHVPTTASTNGTTPVTFTISATTAINAMADKDGLCNSGEIVYKTIEKLPAPTITVRSDGLVEMTCATAEASILYTTDGTTPTLSSTYYNNPIKLSGTVKAIAIKDDYINSDITTEAVQVPAETPVITISKPSGNVTISCATTGSTIYYTTDGSDPDPNNVADSTHPDRPTKTYSTSFTVSNGTTVKAVAKATGYAISEVASNRFMMDSDVSGGKVILNDFEDHTWAYYKGVDTSVDGGNYNTNYAGKLYSPNPRNVKITYKANGGAVSIDESETEFVYYKTLEQGTTAGQYPYQVISNPFSKRPNGKGFGGWKIKEGADYISGYADEATLPLDAEIVFVNLPYTSVNCTSAEIELEATWVNYNNRTYANANTITYSVTGGTYETNFLVLNRNVTGTITVSSPCTIMMVEPDGSTDYRGSYTFTGNITPNNNGVTKIEFTKWNSTNTLNCNNHSVTVGRGMTTTSQCANYVTGVTGTTSNQQNQRTTYNSSLNYHLKLESGTFTDVSFLAGTEGTAGYVNCSGTSNQVKGTLGNDYDRAKKDNTKLTVSDELFLGYRPTYANGNQNNANFTCWVKSGNLCSGTTVTNTTFNNQGSPNGGYYGDASQLFYCSVGGTQTYIGKRKVFVEGGILSGIAGGIDSNNPANDESFHLRMTGGQVRGIVYGSGAFAASSGIRRFVVTGGTINGWVAAGCNGTDPSQSGGTLPSDTYVYIGGTAHVGNTTDLTLNTSSDGNIFGAGSGNSAQATTGQVNNSNVVIADKCYIKNNVFGGGNYGYSNATATVYVTGGEVAGSVFGGSNQKQGVTVNLNMTGGQVNKGVYGGSNITGTISNDVTMNINGGQVGTPSADGVIHGGGLGNATRVLGSVNLTLGASTTATDSVTVYGDVYGGSAQGKTNGNTSLTSGAVTNVTLNKGDIHGSLYGGGLGNNTYAADVYGPVTVVVNGGSVTNADGTAGVFGCNNVKGAPQSTVTVTVTNTNHAGIDNIFGGGNHADYPALGGADYPTVTMTGGLVNNSVFGGGNEADIKGNANVSISGGTIINRVFGGGNLGSVGTFASTTSVTGHTSHSGCIGKPNTWTVGGTCTVTISGGKVGKDNMTMPQDFGYVFGASRGETIDPATDTDIDFRAYVKETEVIIKNTYADGHDGDVNYITKSPLIFGGVYGGSENGHVRGNTHVKIQGGQIGCGDGMSTAYTETQWSTAATAVKSGNAADINSAAAAMPECAHWRYQNPYLPYDMNNATAGGATTGSDGHTFYGNVFGGGSGYFPYEKGGNGATNGYEWNMNAGLVEGNTKVEITGGHILTSIYGGNEMTNVTGDSCVVIMTGGTLGVPRTVAQTAEHPVTCYLFGAGKGDQRTHFNESTNVNNVRVKVGGNAMIYGSIFGGGEDGHVKGNAKIEVTGGHIGTWGTTYVDGNIFGGGRGFAGDALTSGVVQGNVTINISGGTMLGSVYGGGRLGSVGTYLVATDHANYGKLMGSTGDTDHGNVTITISGGTIGNTFEYIVPSGNWNQTWKNNNNIPLTEFGTADTDANRLMHTKGGNVFGGSMGRLYQLNGITPISDWPDLGKVRKTEINISGGTIKSNVYGGGELGTVAEGTTINITGGTIGTGVGDVGGNPSYTYGSVFGGGYGSEDNINGSLNDTRSIVNSRDHAGLVTGNTDIDISETDGSTRIWASVYGGGELAKVNGSTDINIAAGKIGKEVVWHTGDAGKPGWANDGYVRYGGYRMGNVFGGGKGSLNYITAGLVTGNAKVLISGGNVYHNVYGGGALGSVGTFTVSGGNTTCAENTGQTEVTITGGTIGINGYDNGMVNGSSRGAEGNPAGTNIDRVAWVNNSIVTIGTDDAASYADFTTPVVHGSIYGGGENGHNYDYTQVNIFSGTVGNATGDYDHGNIYGAGCGTDTYEYPANSNIYYNNPQAGIVHGTATVNVKGGHVMRNIYGGGSMGTTQGKATVNITGGRVGSVFGGPKGKEGALSENDVPFAYCGIETEVDINYTGTTPASDNGSTTQLVTGSVYGGGEAGNVEGYVVVNMKNGLVLGNLYGGGALADTNIDNAQHYHEANETVPSTSTHTTTVNLTGGTINGSVYGGGLGRKNGINGATSDKAARVYGDVTVELNKTVATDKCWVKGKIFGCNNLNGTPKGHAKVHIYKTVTKNASDAVAAKPTKKTNTYELSAVYGGGNMAAYEPVSNTDFSEVIIEGCDYTSIETVYGGGNAASAPATEVTVNSCYEIGTIFGGGNGKDDLPNGQPNPGAHVGYKAANYTYDSTKTREENIAALDAAFESQKSGLIYGTGVSKVNATGGTIHQIFGSSNTKGNVRIASNTYIDQSNDDCRLDLGDVYGGGNEAYMDGGSSLKLGCIDYLHTLYGGANAADVGGDIELTITSGRFDRVFGGNNVRGTISGSITVNVEETGCHPIVIGELYGCGNQAPYKTPGSKQPTINAKSFTSIGRIFGGGLGATAIVEGSPTVNVNEVKGKNHNGDVAAGTYDYDVYDETTNPDGHYDKDGNFKEWTVEYHDDATAPTTVTSSVTVPTHTKGKIGAIGTIFGGGNAAKVDGSTTVNIGTATDVYLVKPVTVGTTNVSTFYTRSGAGTTSSPYAYTQASGTAVADTTYYEKKTVEGADIRGNVFGGGNAADVTGNTSVNIGR